MVSLCSTMAYLLQKKHYSKGMFGSLVFFFYPHYLDDQNLPSFIIEVNKPYYKLYLVR